MSLYLYISNIVRLLSHGLSNLHHHMTTISLKYIRNIVRLLSHGLNNLYYHMSTVYYTHNTSAIYPAYITWNQQSRSSHVTISLIHHSSTITGPKALSTNLSAMSPDYSQPIAFIIHYRPHDLINMLSNEQPFIPDHGPRLTLPKLTREPT